MDSEEKLALKRLQELLINNPEATKDLAVIAAYMDRVELYFQALADEQERATNKEIAGWRLSQTDA